MNALGLFISMVAFYLLAPQPVFPMKSHLVTTIVSLLLQGIGSAIILVSSYSCALNAALAMPQFGDDVSTCWFPVGLCDNAGPDGGHAHRLPGLLLQGQGGRGGGGGEGGGEGDGGE